MYEDLNYLKIMFKICYKCKNRNT